MVDSDSKDGTGAGDHDVVYRWGHPTIGMDRWTHLHLAILRGAILDFKMGVPGGPADGDLEGDKSE